MPRILNFAAALEDARAHADDDLTVLLGNGFSMDFDHTIFGYDSLAEEAELTDLSVPKADLFESLNSSNFETVIDKLKSAAALIDLYGGDSDLAQKYKQDAKVVRNGLADVLAARHPDAASEVSDEEASHAKSFLANFRRIYTLSYDLLLYWVVNRTEVEPWAPMRDGFEYPAWNVRTALIWKVRPTQGTQQIHYLHGALHYFPEAVEGVEGKRLVKMHAFSRLVGVLRQRLNQNKYPLVVTEGTTAEKLAHIKGSGYLTTMLNRFGELEGALFVHGVSMLHNDDHIWEPLEQETSNVTGLYVGIHGDPASQSNQKVIERAELIRSRRDAAGGRRLRLRFYDTETAHVWRD